MKPSRRNFLGALTAPLCVFALGCTSSDNTKIVDVPPPPPPTEADQPLHRVAHGDHRAERQQQPSRRSRGDQDLPVAVVEYSQPV